MKYIELSGSSIKEDIQGIKRAIDENSDIISSYVFRQGVGGSNYSASTAVGLFNSVINCVLVVTANSASKKFTDSGLF